MLRRKRKKKTNKKNECLDSFTRKEGRKGYTREEEREESALQGTGG